MQFMFTENQSKQVSSSKSCDNKVLLCMSWEQNCFIWQELIHNSHSWWHANLQKKQQHHFSLSFVIQWMQLQFSCQALEVSKHVSIIRQPIEGKLQQRCKQQYISINPFCCNIFAKNKWYYLDWQCWQKRENSANNDLVGTMKVWPLQKKRFLDWNLGACHFCLTNYNNQSSSQQKMVLKTKKDT